MRQYRTVDSVSASQPTTVALLCNATRRFDPRRLAAQHLRMGRVGSRTVALIGLAAIIVNLTLLSLTLTPVGYLADWQFFPTFFLAICVFGWAVFLGYSRSDPATRRGGRYKWPAGMFHDLPKPIRVAFLCCGALGIAGFVSFFAAHPPAQPVYDSTVHAYVITENGVRTPISQARYDRIVTEVNRGFLGLPLVFLSAGTSIAVSNSIRLAQPAKQT